MKGIILAGGAGSRLTPSTTFINKHLLNVYSNPMFYYPLSVLLLIGIKEILIISDRQTIKIIKSKIKLPKKISIKYKEQKNKDGIAAAVKESKSFIKGSKKNIFILGDNFFYGSHLIQLIKEALKQKKPCIFLHRVSNPSQYGIAKISGNRITKISEKPKFYISDLAITGLYVFDENIVNYANQIKKSHRGELEITDILNIYNKKKYLNYKVLERGIYWSDMGTPNDLSDVANFVRIIQQKTRVNIADLKEITKKL